MRAYVSLVVLLALIVAAGLLPYMHTTVATVETIPGEGVPLFVFLDDPAATAFAANFEKDFPISVEVVHWTVAGGTPRTETSPAVIRAVFGALRDMTVLTREENEHTDDYLVYTFRMADGDEIAFEFQSGRLLMHDVYRSREVTGFDALYQAFPPVYGD